MISIIRKYFELVVVGQLPALVYIDAIKYIVNIQTKKKEKCTAYCNMR